MTIAWRSRRAWFRGPRVIWVGDTHRPEYSIAFRVVRETAELRVWKKKIGIDPGQSRPYPHLAILPQSFPGEVRELDVRRILHASPLTRCIVLLGPWLEGVRRSGRPIAGALSITWREFPAWWLRNFVRWREGKAPKWTELLSGHSRPSGFSAGTLPGRTAPAVEPPTPQVTLLVANPCLRRLYRDLLARSLAVEASETSPTDAPDHDPLEGTCVLWDGTPSPRGAAIPFSEAIRIAAGRPVVAVLHAVTPSTCHAMLQQGAVAVFGKPFDLLDLQAAMEQACQAQRGAVRPDRVPAAIAETGLKAGDEEWIQRSG